MQVDRLSVQLLRICMSKNGAADAMANDETLPFVSEDGRSCWTAA